MRILRRLRGGSLGTANSLQEEVGYNFGAQLTGLSFYVRDGVWHAVVKADFSGRPMVAFLNVGSFARCVEVTCEYTFHSWLRWKDDNKPPKTRTYRRHPSVNPLRRKGGA